MQRAGEIAKVVIVNLLILLAGLVIVELIWGSWFSNVHALHQFTKPRNIDLKYPNPVGGEPKIVHYRRDSYGFRNLDGPVNNIDIIFMGGSTTDQRYLDDNFTYESVLKQLFARNGRKLVVANAGIDGQSTIGHIYNFGSWLNRIEGLKARHVMFYIGINDQLRLGETPLYDPVDAEGLRLKLQLYIREKSVLYQLYLIAKRQLTPSPLVHGRSPHIAEGEGLVDKPAYSNYETKEVRESLSALKERVKKLVDLTNGIGAKAIVVTQRSARWDMVIGRLVGIPHWLEGENNEFRMIGDVNGVDIYHIERLTADAILAGCKEAGGICVDLMGGIRFDLRRDFYDAVHTTNSGSRKIGEFLYKELADKIK